MAVLDDIKWGVQYGAYDPQSSATASKKTISGLNLNDSGTAEANAENADTASLLVTTIMRLSRYEKGSVSLIETRGVVG